MADQPSPADPGDPADPVAGPAAGAGLPPLHPAAARVQATLDAYQAVGRVRRLSDSARTAAEAAAALGCSVGAIVKSLLFLADGSPVLILASGAHRVDTTKVAALLGVGSLAPADPDTVRRVTGFAIGGVAPVGHPEPVGTVVDIALQRYDVVWAAAGTPHDVFPTTYEELLRLTAGEPAEVM
ncbi:MAG: YbaK/EbsC family protein [Frankiaceae bacterium]